MERGLFDVGLGPEGVEKKEQARVGQWLVWEVKMDFEQAADFVVGRLKKLFDCLSNSSLHFEEFY